MILGPIKLYAHEQTDEDYSHYVEQMMALGIPQDEAESFITSNPLYEVLFEFHVDTDKHIAYCTRVDLGDGEPFERSYPGQQLSLFGKESPCANSCSCCSQG